MMKRIDWDAVTNTVLTVVYLAVLVMVMVVPTVAMIELGPGWPWK